MTAEWFWSATPREFQAFVRVKAGHDDNEAMRWAITCAMFANANFRGRQHPHAFTADEFLGRTIEAVEALTPEQKAFLAREQMRINLALTGVLRDDSVPEWAKATVEASRIHAPETAMPDPRAGNGGARSTSFVFEDSPEGRAKMEEWMRSQWRGPKPHH
jgi:hypothetical protein